MLTKVDYLLLKLAKDCNEVSKRALKAVQFGLSEKGENEFNNCESIAYGLANLTTVVGMLGEEKEWTEAGSSLEDGSGDVFDSVIEARKAKTEKYMAVSRELGKLEPKA